MIVNEKLLALAWGVRQYRPSCTYKNGVEKTWNRGMGSLILFRFYFDRKIVLVNSALANKSDMKHLDSFLNELGCTDFEIRMKAYGYPTYYTSSFGL